VAGRVMIHHEHPFRPTEGGDPVRRLRGRIAAGVTVVTSGGADERSGSTVASILVVEGAPARLVLSLAEGSDVLEVIRQTKRFVVHVLAAEDRALSDRFALVSPSPGGLFTGVAYDDGEWGPELAVAGTRGRATVERVERVGYQQLVVATLDEVVLADLERPLIWFRGRYMRLP
jgi:3-hydroxy-9,10-secoandrosta-1,3,5(10)-triene-9,17-dione monooxygenase reductase component